MKSVRFNHLARLVMAAALTLGLAACGGGGSKDTEPPVDTGPTLAERQAAQQSAIDMATAAVRTALTNLSASNPTQAQVDALATANTQLSTAITAAVDLGDSAIAGANGQLTFAQSAATTAQASINATAKAGRAATQQTAIDTASGEVSAALAALGTPVPTQAQVDALDAAIMKLEAAITAAVDVDDTTAADEEVTSAKAESMTAQTAVTTALNERRSTQAAAIDSAMSHVHVAMLAVTNAGDAVSQAEVDALSAAVTMLDAAITAAVDRTDDEKAAANASLATARSALVTAMGNVDEDRDGRVTEQRAAINMASGMVRSAQSDLATPPTQAQVTALGTAIAALETAIADAADLSADELGTASALVTSAKSAQTLAQADVDAEKVKQQMAMNAAAMQVGKAINAHKATSATVANQPPAEFRVRSTPYTLAQGTNFGVSRGSGDAVFTLTQTTSDAKLKPFTMGSAPDAGTGWMGKTFTRSGTAAKKAFTEEAAVYSDIEALSDALWAGTTDPWAGDNDGVARGTEDEGYRLTLTRQTIRGVSDVSSVPAARFGGGASVPAFVKGQTNSLEIDDGIAGTLYGVAGTFTCVSATGDDCELSQNKYGQVVLPAGGVLFTPTASKFDVDTTMAKNVTADTDYTHFGYWMKSTKQRDGSYEHDVETFQRGGAAASTITSTGDGALSGTAKYYGAAAGVYVKRAGAGDSLVVTDGTFTADAMLTARFGGTKVAADDHYSVTGTISDFMDDGGTDLGFADLTLRGLTATSGATIGATGGITGGETDGGGTSGTWSGQFYGVTNTGNDNADGSADDATNNYPADVAGEFNGHFTNGDVAGAFGAEKD